MSWQTISFTPRPAFAFETVTVDATAGGVRLTATTYHKQVGGSAPERMMARKAFITTETAPMRMTLHPGGAPEAATGGHEVAANYSFELEGQQIADFRAIRTTGTSAVLRVTYFL